MFEAHTTPKRQPLKVSVPRALRFRGPARKRVKIAACHSDDETQLGFAAIWEAYKKEDARISAVVMADGRGSPQKGGGNRDPSSDKLWATRRQESIRAARIARLRAISFLDYPTKALRDPANEEPTRDLQEVLNDEPADMIFTHSPWDRHPSHRACFERTVAAIRSLPVAKQPTLLYGGEVWCSHDWVAERWRVRFDVSGGLRLARRLLKQFRSQIRARHYDRGAISRWIQHATYEEAHDVQKARAVAFAVNLTPLIEDPRLTIEEFVETVVGSSLHYEFPLLGAASEQAAPAASRVPHAVSPR